MRDALFIDGETCGSFWSSDDDELSLLEESSLLLLDALSLPPSDALFSDAAVPLPLLLLPPSSLSSPLLLPSPPALLSSPLLPLSSSSSLPLLEDPVELEEVPVLDLDLDVVGVGELVVGEGSELEERRLVRSTERVDDTAPALV